ncbi:MAG: hypothetical protein M1825_005024 [Sarcosagium campestre]|nr:MAG: hypothetical protein M1825_005024 [Sarcosagium campestre]
MALVVQNRIRGRPAHTPGPTFLSYTPNGRRLVTAGSNNAIRVYDTGSDGEPANVDDCQESNTAVVASNDFFITGSEDGTVCQYSLRTHSLEKILVRSTLPVRDIALSPNGRWAAVASDELVVKIVNTSDMHQVFYIRDQPKPTKHLSFHPSGDELAVSCSNGIIYIYSLTHGEDPVLIKKIDGVIRSLETDEEASSKVEWHPDGTAFAAATATRDIQVVSRGNWEKEREFSDGHTGHITDLAWSPNGALFISAAADRKILLWDSKTQTALAKYDYANVMAVAWHPTNNIVSFTNTDGEVFINPDFVPSEHAALLQKPLQSALSLQGPLAETSANAQRPLINGSKGSTRQERPRRGTPDSLDDLLGPDGVDENDDFVSDDDGAGYIEDVNENGKRTNAHLPDEDGYVSKRWAPQSYWEPKLHESFQPGSTPWRGDRRYLCLNLTGAIWTIDQETHHTVTVEFYDREAHRDFHFTDPYLYDKACLNEHGSLFSCPSTTESPAILFYRPHETWTTRADWRTELPDGENVTAMSLSESFIVVTTSLNYVRVFTLFGTPFRVYRQKSSPTVSCASWRDYVLTMGNGPASGSGSATLTYTIENIKHDEILQNNDIVALPEGVRVKSVFFSENGDPCIYDSTGVLLVLLHWRSPGQARWVPLLDTKRLDRLLSGRKDESYWPVAVAQDRFHCIILKGGDKHPYFPRPLLSEFDFDIPLSRPKVDDREDTNVSLPESRRHEEKFVKNSLLLTLMEDLVGATNATHAQRTELARMEVEVDKVLLQLLATECREGEERGMKALEIVGLMRDRSGNMLEAAGKVAARYGRTVLEEKIREAAERKLLGMEE